MTAVSPALSVVVPCRNERDHIEACVRSILTQEPPPGGFEIIVADGMSDDGTRDILEQLAEEDPRLQVVDNPGRTAPCARNTGIRMARGSLVAILDAHTEYASDYLRTCVDLLKEHPEVCCSGGPITSRGTTLFGRAVAAAMSHPAGIGNATHRVPDYEGYAEGACFPVFRRNVFDRVGLFDEQLVRNQDDEFNYRVARSGGKIFISPRAKCIYHVRETPRRLFDQYLGYGYWRVAVLRKHRRPASPRHLAPIGFFSLMIAAAIVAIWLPGWWRVAAASVPVAYALVLVTAGIRVMRSQGVVVGLLFPIAAAIMHVAYAVGFVWGLTNATKRRSGPGIQ